VAFIRAGFKLVQFVENPAARAAKNRGHWQVMTVAAVANLVAAKADSDACAAGSKTEWAAVTAWQTVAIAVANLARAGTADAVGPDSALVDWMDELPAIIRLLIA
jgi:hypothetical protein